MSRAGWKIILVIVGLAAFGWYVSRLDVRGAGRVFLALGAFAPCVLLPYALVYAVDTVAWRLAFLRPPNVPLTRLFRIRWAGEAVNNTIPSGYVGGEVVKVFLLRKRHVPMDAATASVVVSKTAQTVAQVGFIAAAAAVFLHEAQQPAALRIALWTIVSGGVGAMLIAGWLQYRGLFKSLAGILNFIGWKSQWLDRIRPSLEQMDRATHAFYREKPLRLVASVSTYFVGWLLDTVELFVFAWLSGRPIAWWQAFVVEAFTGVAKAVGWFVPGSAGVQESGVVFFGRLAGLPDSLCIAYAVFRRFRETAYALVGWSLLWIEEGAGIFSWKIKAPVGQS